MIDPPRDDASAAPWVRVAVERSLAARRDKIVGRGERIVESVVELLHEVSDEFTIDDVVRRSGVSRRTFHHLFDSKDEAILAALESLTADRFVQQQDAFTRHEGDPVAQLHAVVLVRWRWPDGQTLPLARAVASTFPRLRTRLPAQIVESQRATNHFVVLALRACRAGGLLRASTLDDQELAGLIGNLMAATLTNRVLGLADDVATVPPDDAGFDPVWTFVAQAALRDDVARPDAPPRRSRRQRQSRPR